MNNNNNNLSGKIANKNGKIFEEMLIPLFIKNGYIIKLNSEFNNNAKYDEFLNNNSKFIIKNAKYKTIYNHNGKSEYLLINKDLDKRIRIECKWQQSSGSVDEKFPYLYLNCIFAYNEKDIILIIDGGGYKKGSIDWLKIQIKNNWLNENKNIQLMNLSEFISWFNELHK